jgi:hypothetical protein
MVPLHLEYPDDDEEGVEEEAPGPSSDTSSNAMIDSKKMSDLKRGQHGRHQIRNKVHLIHKIGPKGEPLEPTIIISTFSNQCSYIVREKVPITYDDWRKVPKDIKGNVWGEVKRRFTYPAEGYDEDKCMGRALFVVGKALCNFRSMHNRKYV